MHLHSLTGNVPRELCNSRRLNEPLLSGFGCDAILCPLGTFHPDGVATNLGGCRPCPVDIQIDEDGFETSNASPYLGTTKCATADFHGDHWGHAFRDWMDMTVPSCSLPGVECRNGVDVTSINLKDA
eukprot:13485965-Ditylum_brightwellii.AAC.1